MLRKTLALLVVAMAAPSFAYSEWVDQRTGVSCDLTSADFLDSSNGVAAGFNGCIAKTSDGGLHWRQIDTGIPESFVSTHFVDPSTIYAGRIGLYRSTDAGFTWQELGSLSSILSSIFSMHFSLEPNTFQIIKGSQILLTFDGGVTFVPTFEGGLDDYIDTLEFPVPEIGYATGGITTDSGSFATVLKTIDSGGSWNRLEAPFAQVMASSFVGTDRGLLATFPGEFEWTTDGGTTWSSVPTDLPVGEVVMDMVCTVEWHCTAVTLAGNIYESEDVAAHWTLVYSDRGGRALEALSRGSGPLVAVGNGGLVVLRNLSTPKDVIFADGFE